MVHSNANNMCFCSGFHDDKKMGPFVKVQIHVESRSQSSTPPPHRPGLFYMLIFQTVDIFSIFESFCNHELFARLNLPMFPVLVRGREKSQKSFNLLALFKLFISVQYS